ncbi:hypothetical protein ACRYCC_27595 [Actinomadura scrupuli]|uniref:hypothetical protein n=1 Tax=Actinomadura scrupuli TaxID=559629 RepID=UPI003D975BF6
MSFYSLSPHAMLDYAMHRARSELGYHDPRWSSLILAASTRTRRADSPIDREVYRSAALEAIDGARSCSAISKSQLDYEDINIRVSYILRFEKDMKWIEAEARNVAKIFLGSLKLDYEAVKKLIPTGPDRTPPETVGALYGIRGLLALLSGIAHLIPAEDKIEVDRWLAISDEIK